MEPAGEPNGPPDGEQFAEDCPEEYPSEIWRRPMLSAIMERSSQTENFSFFKAIRRPAEDGSHSCRAMEIEHGQEEQDQPEDREGGTKESAKRDIFMGSLFVIVIVFVGIYFFFKEDGEGSTRASSSTAPTNVPAQPGLQTGGLGSVEPNDLHALHDLLLLGFAGIYMRNSSAAGLKLLRDEVVSFAKLLADIHPIPECRAQLSQQTLRLSDIELVRDRARISWECLPARFNATDFSDAVSITGDVAVDRETAHQHRAEQVKDRELLHACRLSRWDRSCSYWVLLHTMAAQAEVTGNGFQFMKSVLMLLAGGALVCKQSQRHLRLLTRPLLNNLSSTFFAETLNDTEITQFGFCSLHTSEDRWSGESRQCVMAGRRINFMHDCLEDREVCVALGMDSELQDIYAYRDFIMGPGRDAPFASFIILHNLVTASIGNRFFRNGRRKFACVRDAARVLTIGRKPLLDVPFTPKIPGGSEYSGLPGIGQHRLLDCDV